MPETVGVVAFLILLLTDVSPWVLTPLLLIFFVDWLVHRLPAGTGLLRQSLQPVYLLLLGAVPGALAVVFAWYTGTARPESHLSWSNSVRLGRS